MLVITIPESDYFDENTEEFVRVEAVRLEFEHSPFTLSKWESEWEKPFLTPGAKSPEEMFGYIQAMCLTPNTPPETFHRLTNSDLRRINEYIEAKMSATWFNEQAQKPGRREIITAEIIYYWMVSLNIPMECEHWHLNRLFTLVKVCNEKNAPEKKPKRSAAEMAAERRALNDQRRAQLKTSG